MTLASSAFSIGSAVSANSLLADALSQGGRVDFASVTEICERARGDALQAESLVRALTTALKSGLDVDDLSLQVKAVTVAHELLYDSAARRAMFDHSHFLSTLARARDSPSARGEGPPAECIRLFSREVLRQLLQEFSFRL